MASANAGSMTLHHNGTIVESSGSLSGADKVAHIVIGILQDSAAVLKTLPHNEGFKRLTITVDQTRYAVVMVKDRIQVVTL